MVTSTDLVWREKARARARGAEQRAVGVLDAGLLGGLDVGLVVRVGRAHLDDRVEPVGREDSRAAAEELQGGQNRCGCVENGHDCPHECANGLSGRSE
jgi:hypothetical protein